MREPDDPARQELAQAYDRLVGPLYRYALMILASAADAEDVVQNVFVAMADHITRLETIDSADGYLRRAVRNECYSLLRRRRRHPSHSDDDLLEAIEARCERLDERLALDRALRALPPNQREVVQLKAFEGMTFEAIATVCGESINTVAGRYRYALQAMRKLLGEDSE